MGRTSSAKPSSGVKSVPAETPRTVARTKKTRTATSRGPHAPAARRRGTSANNTPPRDEPTLESEFISAMQDYKKSSGRMFPTWSEVLEVLQHLGYRKLDDGTEETTATAEAS